VKPHLLRQSGPQQQSAPGIYEKPAVQNWVTVLAFDAGAASRSIASPHTRNSDVEQDKTLHICSSHSKEQCCIASSADDSHVAAGTTQQCSERLQAELESKRMLQSTIVAHLLHPQIQLALLSQRARRAPQLSQKICAWSRIAALIR
jgi:hypothetical protein